MNIKDWKAFQTYRSQQIAKFYRSKEYRDLLVEEKAELDKICNKPKIKYQFLWWKWETKDNYDYFDHINLTTAIKYYQHRKEDLRMSPKFYCPNETIEDCLNWLAGGKK
jgi:hypothetical protein